MMIVILWPHLSPCHFMTVSSMAARNLPYRPASFSVHEVTVYVMSQNILS